MVRLGQMSWIDDQKAKRDNLPLREGQLTVQAPAVWADLKERVIALAEEANKKLDLKLTLKGFPNKFEITAGVVRSYGPPAPANTLTLALSNNERTVTASFPGTLPLEFEIGIADEIVCLMRGDAAVPSQEAAYKIMGPFLFPENHGLKRNQDTPL